MDIDRLNPLPQARVATGDVGDLLGRLQAAGSVEAEVIRVLKDQLLLRSELGEILTRNRLELRPGDRLRIRLAGSDSEPVLRVSPAPPRPAKVAVSEVPQLSQTLPAERPVLAEILRVLPRATEIRIAGRRYELPLRIETSGLPLLSLERRPATRSIELQPLARAPLYRALLRHLLPRQAPDDADSLLRLLDRVRPRPASPEGAPARFESTRRAAAVKPREAAAPPAMPTPSLTARRAPQAIPAEPPRAPVVTPAARSSTSPAAPVVNRAQPADHGPASATTPRGQQSLHASPGDAPTRPGVTLLATRTGQSASSPPQVSRGDAAAATWPSADNAIRQRADVSAPAAAVRVPAPARDAVPQARLPATAPAPLTPPAPLAQLVEWLPRSAEFDAPRLRHWIELLGFARPAAPDGARPPDLIDWLRQLQAFDTAPREPAATAARRAAPPGGGESLSAAADDRDASPALPRESLRLAEQAVMHNLLQRAAAGLQQEIQQPLNLSLTLPFVDGGELRPLRIELEQRGRHGEEGADSAWELRVSFEFGRLGPITCHLVLAGRALAASFYCELDATRERVASALPELRRQLDAAGFDPGELQSFAGRARAPRPAASVDADFLIDLEA